MTKSNGCNCQRCREYNQKNPDYYRTIVNSHQWQEWEKVAHEYGFDWHESVETGWLSDKHFQAFLEWYKKL